jgi:hypothetical protein
MFLLYRLNKSLNKTINKGKRTQKHNKRGKPERQIARKRPRLGADKKTKRIIVFRVVSGAFSRAAKTRIHRKTTALLE